MWGPDIGTICVVRPSVCHTRMSLELSEIDVWSLGNSNRNRRPSWFRICHQIHNYKYASAILGVSGLLSLINCTLETAPHWAPWQYLALFVVRWSAHVSTLWWLVSVVLQQFTGNTWLCGTSRSGGTSRLIVPSVRCSTVGDRAFSVAGPRVWHTLPEEITASQSLPIFRHQLKTWLFRKSYPDIIMCWLLNV